MSWVCKSNNLFLTFSETEAKFIFEGFWYCHLRKVQFQRFTAFLTFLVWSVNCSSHAFIHSLLVSKLYELGLWTIKYIWDMSRSLSISFYFRPFSITIYGKFNSCYWYLFNFFRSAKCENVVCISYLLF